MKSIFLAATTMQYYICMRVVLVRSRHRPHWPSCITIAENVAASFKPILGEKIEVEYSGDESLRRTRAVAARIRRLRPDRVVFTNDIAEFYCNLVENLADLRGSSGARSSFLFYVFGNFTVELRTWARLGAALVGHPTYLLCGSSRQANLVRSFLQPRCGANVVTLPFPVDVERFAPDPVSREATRKKLGWEESLVFLYVGRIARQKNVRELVEEWVKVSDDLPKSSALALVGSFDERRSLLFRETSAKSKSYRAEFERCLRFLPRKKRERVHWLGEFRREDLPILYRAADCFVSLSTYHDEDFGMAPAEALASGLPCLLSDWGGYADFAANVAHCRTVPVAIDRQKLRIDFHAFRSELRRLASTAVSSRAFRPKNAVAFARVYGSRGVARGLTKLLARPAPKFGGVSSKLYFQAALFDGRPGRGCYLVPGAADSLYYLNYSHYTG